MAKDKKKNKKQNKSEVKQAPPITLSGEDLQHLIAHAIIEADEIKEEALRKQQDAELLEWRVATGYKEFSDKSKFLRSVKTFFNRFWCFIKLCFVPSKAIKGDRASFALMKLFLCAFFGFAKWILGLSSLMFILYGIILFFAPETMPVLWISNIGLIVLGITVFLTLGDSLILGFLHDGTEGDLALTLESGREYLLYLLIGLLVMVSGYILMTGGGSEDPEVFNYAMFDFRRMVAAPLVIILGIVIEIAAIMGVFKGKEEK
jgi:hypothetical protein